MYEKTLQKIFVWSGRKLNKLNGGLTHNKSGQPNKKRTKKNATTTKR